MARFAEHHGTNLNFNVGFGAAGIETPAGGEYRHCVNNEKKISSRLESLERELQLRKEELRQKQEASATSSSSNDTLSVEIESLRLQIIRLQEEKRRSDIKHAASMFELQQLQSIQALQNAMLRGSDFPVPPDIFFLVSPGTSPPASAPIKEMNGDSNKIVEIDSDEEEIKCDNPTTAGLKHEEKSVPANDSNGGSLNTEKFSASYVQPGYTVEMSSTAVSSNGPTTSACWTDAKTRFMNDLRRDKTGSEVQTDVSIAQLANKVASLQGIIDTLTLENRTLRREKEVLEAELLKLKTAPTTPTAKYGDFANSKLAAGTPLYGTPVGRQTVETSYKRSDHVEQVLTHSIPTGPRLLSSNIRLVSAQTYDEPHMGLYRGGLYTQPVQRQSFGVGNDARFVGQRSSGSQQFPQSAGMGTDSRFQFPSSTAMGNDLRFQQFPQSTAMGNDPRFRQFPQSVGMGSDSRFQAVPQSTPQIYPQAQRAESSASFNGANFNGTSMNGANFNGTSFNGTSFNGTSFNGTSMNGTSMNGTSMNGTRLPFSLPAAFSHSVSMSGYIAR